MMDDGMKNIINKIRFLELDISFKVKPRNAFTSLKTSKS